MDSLHVTNLPMHELRLIAGMRGVKVKKGTLKKMNYLKF